MLYDTRNSSSASYFSVINAENAAHHSEKFYAMASRTRQEYLKDLATNYVTSNSLESASKLSKILFMSQLCHIMPLEKCSTNLIFFIVLKDLYCNDIEYTLYISLSLVTQCCCLKVIGRSSTPSPS